MIKSSKCCCYPGPPTSAVTEHRKPAGKSTPLLQTFTRLLQKVPRKKLSNLAFQPLESLVHQARKNFKCTQHRKALQQVRVPRGPRSNFTLQSNPTREPAHQQCHQTFFLLKKKTEWDLKQDAPDGSAGKMKSWPPTPEPTYPSTTTAKAKSTSHYRCRCGPIQSTWNIAHVWDREQGKKNEYLKINDVSLSSYIKLIWKGFNFLKG